MVGISIIVAVSRITNGIGIKGQLPWHLTSDLKRFRELTISTVDTNKQNAIVMGRKTWESLPLKYRPLPNRVNVVLSRDPIFRASLSTHTNVLTAGNLDEAFSALTSVEHIFIIGGQSLYEEAVQHPRCTRVYITLVDGEYECDAFFPVSLTSFGFIETIVSPIQIENNISFQYIQLDRNGTKSDVY
jgi:dihydrofolate reductase